MDGWNEGRRRRGKWEVFDEGKINDSSVALEKQQIMVIIIMPLLLMIATMMVMAIIVIVTIVMLSQLDD